MDRLTQVEVWKDIKKVTDSVRDCAIRPTRSYFELKFSEHILQNIPLINCEDMECHIGDRNRIKLKNIRNSVLRLVILMKDIYLFFFGRGHLVVFQ
jgi:hypothetical protein